MSWAQICELAECSPDFDVTLSLPRHRAVYWLRARLLNRGFDVSARDIDLAYETVRSDAQ